MAGKWDDRVQEFIDRWAIWTVKQRTGQVRVTVRTLDAKRAWDRIDVQVKTDRGDKIWVSDRNLELIPV